MSTSISQRERVLYEDVFDTIKHYADFSPGKEYVPMFLDMACIEKWQASRYEVLDAGCGTGQGAMALRDVGFKVRMCDITPSGLLPEARDMPFSEVVLWQPLKGKTGYVQGGRFDYVYCTDVLEHIPPQLTMLVISRLLEVTHRGLFLSISLTRDNLGVWLGKQLHQTVQSFVWWRDNLNDIGQVIEARDLLNTGIYLVAPKD